MQLLQEVLVGNLRKLLPCKISTSSLIFSWGDLRAVFQYLKGGFLEGMGQTLQQVCGDRARENDLKPKEGRSRLDFYLFHNRGGDALAQVA